MRLKIKCYQRKVDLEQRPFQKRWVIDYIFMEFNVTASNFSCKRKAAILKAYNLKHYWFTKHTE